MSRCSVKRGIYFQRGWVQQIQKSRTLNKSNELRYTGRYFLENIIEIEKKNLKAIRRRAELKSKGHVHIKNTF